MRRAGQVAYGARPSWGAPRESKAPRNLAESQDSRRGSAPPSPLCTFPCESPATMTAANSPRVSMSKRTCLAIVLAAGEGTRMRSARPKVLHEVAGRSLLGHVLHAVRGAGMDACAVVVGPNCEPVAGEARAVVPKADVFVQHERRGT